MACNLPHQSSVDDDVEELELWLATTVHAAQEVFDTLPGTVAAVAPAPPSVPTTSISSSLTHADVAEKMESSLTCAVCCEMYNTPRMLPCLHTFCEPCIAQFSAAQKIPPYLCPTCRAPYAKAGPFQMNIVANDMVELVKLQRSCSVSSAGDGAAAGGPPCDHCKDKAVQACKMCGECLCDFHVLAHAKTDKTASHQLTDLPSMVSNATAAVSAGKAFNMPVKPATCPKHEGEPMKMYCQERGCLFPVCRDCVIVSHRTHTVVELSSVHAALCKKVNDAVQTANAHSRTVTAARGDIAHSRAKLVTSKATAIQEAQAAGEAIVAKVTARVAAIVQSLNTNATRLDGDLQQHDDELKAIVTSLDDAAALGVHVSQGRMDFAAMVTPVLTRLTELAGQRDKWRLTPAVDGVLTFASSGNDKVLAAVDEFGSIDTGEYDPRHLTLACADDGNAVSVTLTPRTGLPATRLVKVQAVGVGAGVPVVMRVVEGKLQGRQTVDAPGDLQLIATIGGRHVRNSPLTYEFPSMPFSFTNFSASIVQADRLDPKTLRFQQSVATAYAAIPAAPIYVASFAFKGAAICTPAITGTKSWCFAINNIFTGYCTFGIIGSIITENPEQQPTFYGISTAGKVFEKGQYVRSVAIAQQGDLVIFQYAQADAKLQVSVFRNQTLVGKAETIQTMAGIYYPCVLHHIQPDRHNRHPQPHDPTEILLQPSPRSLMQMMKSLQ